MTISKETELGNITISNNVFAAVIRDTLHTKECRDKAWPGTKKGRRIGSNERISLNELANNIEIEADEEGRIYIDFSIIIKFGVSIRTTTDFIAKYIKESLEESQGVNIAQITVRISGVKSKQTARRNTEVVKRYDQE